MPKPGIDSSVWRSRSMLRSQKMYGGSTSAIFRNERPELMPKSISQVAGAAKASPRRRVSLSARDRYKLGIVAPDPAAKRGSWKLVFKLAVSLGLLAVLARHVDFS